MSLVKVFVGENSLSLKFLNLSVYNLADKNYLLLLFLLIFI